jgi:hypothetical protein
MNFPPAGRRRRRRLLLSHGLLVVYVCCVAVVRWPTGGGPSESRERSLMAMMANNSRNVRNGSSERRAGVGQLKRRRPAAGLSRRATERRHRQIDSPGRQHARRRRLASGRAGPVKILVDHCCHTEAGLGRWTHASAAVVCNSSGPGSRTGSRSGEMAADKRTTRAK